MKKLILLFLVFAGLAAFVYFYEIKGGEEREAAKKLEESLLGLEKDQISAIEIATPGNDPIVLKREGDEWMIVQPVQSASDRFAVDALVRDIADAQKSATFDEGIESLDAYGLETPRAALTVSTADGAKHVVKLGQDDYTGGKIYAQLEGSQSIHLIPKTLVTSAEKKLNDWRSKTVLDFEQDSVKNVEIRRPEGTLRVNREGQNWTIQTPLEDRADSNAVSSLLSSIKYARIDKFVAESDEDLKSYGLDQPQFTLRVQEEGQDTWKTLELGKKDGEAHFARALGRPLIFTVRQDVAEKLGQDIWELRDKNVVDVKQDELSRLLLKKKDGDIEISREGSEFTILAPESVKGKKTPTYKFWYPLSDIQFEKIDEQKSDAADARFQTPDIVLEVTLKDGSTRRYEFAEKSGKQWARQVGGGRSGEISKTAFDKLKLDAESLSS